MSEEHQMTRREYRDQRAHRIQQPLQHSDSQDQANLDDRPLIQKDSTNQESPYLSREESLAAQQATITEEKTNRLRKKLNHIMVGLVIAIILVYLVLFFVG